MYFCHQSAFAKRSLLNEMPFDEKYKMSADFKFFKMAYKRNATFKYIDYPVSIFDNKGVSNTQRAKGLRENVAVIKECDSGFERMRLLLRIWPSLFMASLKK
jgi:hypothetical protein